MNNLTGLTALVTGATSGIGAATAQSACGAAFYDESRNGSRRWHDVKTCGNANNLRVSRARRATRTSAADEVPARS